MNEVELKERYEKGDRDFSHCNLQDVNLTEADLPGMNLSGCDLTRANLYRANLRDSNLQGAILLNANLTFTDLQGCDLSRAVKPEFNNTVLRNSRSSPHDKNKWFELRREYSGAAFSLRILLLIVFFLPYAARAGYWSGVNSTEQLLQSSAIEVGRAGKELEKSPKIELKELSALLVGFGKKITPCGVAKCKQWEVWELLVGRDLGWRETILAVALLFYSIGRGILTWHVAPLCDEETRSGYSPASAHYLWASLTHRFLVRPLFVVAIATVITHLYSTLRLPVALPQ